MILAILVSSRWMTLKRCCVPCFSLIFMASPVMAAGEFWEDRQRGYFWYEDPIFEAPRDPELKDQAVIIQPPDTYSYEELFDLHPDRFQVMIDARLKTAVHDPTEENVLKFLEAVDVAKTKSRTLANVAGYVVIMEDFKQLRDLIREEIGDLENSAELSEELTKKIEELPVSADPDELHGPLQELLDVDYKVRQAIKLMRGAVGGTFN